MEVKVKALKPFDISGNKDFCKVGDVVSIELNRANLLVELGSAELVKSKAKAKAKAKPKAKQMTKFFDSDLAELVGTDDFADVITCSSPSVSFNAIFDYVYGEEMGFGDRQVPTLTATTSSVSALGQDDVLTIPASAIGTSSSSKNFRIMVKQPDNTGMTVIILESV